MSDVVIAAEGLGKKYVIGHESARDGYVALRDILARNARAFTRKAGELFRGQPVVQGDQLEEIWALRGLSFEVRRGEAVGVIGANGAGKSTLLKILSRITEPSEGRATLHGRVASLLEVGTGFHPELTGRENILLNGAILGMSRSEIRRKMDEIVAFAEVERFLDTPVKRYSSGMHVRLAFAVAAHLEPEILIVDEVLAVGDAAFRDKCLGKMREVTGQAGRTILFVSHNMAAIEQLCHWAVVLRHGRMEFQGGTREAVERYAGRGQSAGSKVEFAARTGRGRSEARIVSIATLDASGSARSDFEFGEPVHVAIEYSAETMLRHGVLGCQVRTMSNEPLLTSHWNDVGAAKDIEPGRHTAVCRIDPNPLMPGTYYLEAGIADRGLRVLDLRTNEMSFRIHEAGPGRRQIEPRPGYVYADLQWEMQ